MNIETVTNDGKKLPVEQDGQMGEGRDSWQHMAWSRLTYNILVLSSVYRIWYYVE